MNEHVGVRRFVPSLRGGALGFIHMILLALASPPYDLWPLVYLAMFPLGLVAVRAESRWRATSGVYVGSFIGWAWIQRWVFALAGPGYPILALYLALYPALFVWIVHRTLDVAIADATAAEAKVLRRWRRPRLTIPASVLLPLVWVGLEMVRGAVVFGGYPWFLLAHPTINAPMMAQTADLFGTYFVSFLVAMPAGLLIDILTLPLFVNGKLNRTTRLAVIVNGLVLIASIAYGWHRLGYLGTAPLVSVAAVQTNLPQDTKTTWTIEQQVADFESFVELTERHGATTTTPSGRAPDLVVWPETMVGGVGLNPDAIDAMDDIGVVYTLPDRTVPGDYFDQRLRSMQASMGGPALLVGATAVDGLRLETLPDGSIRSTWDARYNASFHYPANGSVAVTRYDKMHLTPFGEIIPYLHRWPSLQQWVVNIGAAGMSFDLAWGETPVRFAVSVRNPEPEANFDQFRVATPICFESTMPGVCRRLVWDEGGKQADLLVNMTNDGWFKNYRGGREQHVQCGRFRCIENRVPMVRAANTGISAHIDSAGRIMQYGPTHPASTPPSQAAGVMLVDVRLDSRTTIYARIGDAFGWMCMILTIGIAGLGFRQQRINRKAALAANGAA